MRSQSDEVEKVNRRRPEIWTRPVRDGQHKYASPNQRHVNRAPPGQKTLTVEAADDPARGPMRSEVVVQTMAGHDLNHLRQIEEISAM